MCLRTGCLPPTRRSQLLRGPWCQERPTRQATARSAALYLQHSCRLDVLAVDAMHRVQLHQPAQLAVHHHFAVPLTCSEVSAVCGAT